MKIKLFFAFVLSLFGLQVQAQDDVTWLDTTLFDPNFHSIPLSNLENWMYKAGNNPSWAAKDVDMVDWIRLNPAQLTIKNAGEDGRVEGWFRLKIRLDRSFQGIPVGIHANRYAATDVYIDGQLVASFGSTGAGGRPYEEFKGNLDPPVQLNLPLDQDLLIAVYLVDYRSGINPRHLKTHEDNQPGFRHLLFLTGAKQHSAYINFVKEYEVYWTFWTSVCGILSLLFWLIHFQNPNEKNLRLIALVTTLFSIGILLYKIDSLAEESHTAHLTYLYIASFLFNVSSALILVTLAQIFNRKISGLFAFYCVLISLSGITNLYFFEFKIAPIVFGSNVIVSIYLISSSWRRLNGAQWVVAVGILVSFLFAFLHGFHFTKYGFFPYPLSYFFLSGTFLTFPLALTVYVAARFREILVEVRTKAQEVLQINEEKKEILSHQNELLEIQVEERTRELKSTQAQLIQSEKMASLGELTAGIAHEIQNPLNFVNNFSEVNSELIDEQLEEIEKGNLEEIKELAHLLKENSSKITLHGKRADAIVKGMLEHSKKGSGQKEPTDLNALADEFLRLSFQSFLAKEPDFQCELRTELSPDLPKISVIPQDIGKVLLNLMNNAFYACAERSRSAGSSSRHGGQAFDVHHSTLDIQNQPQVTVSTKNLGDKIEISVSDNGPGIPSSIKDKIFQPFFTTKPTGQGTGLGLSLSYDIVKAHGGELKVETKEGEGSEFIIKLPIS
jgi:two-component system, NtrC family, sensor kinase